jgi:hypothetical protein
LKVFTKHSLINIFTILLAGFLHIAFGQDIELQPGTTLHFATVEEAEQILGTSDAYTRTMTPLDRSLQMKSNTALTETDFLNHATAVPQRAKFFYFPPIS